MKRCSLFFFLLCGGVVAFPPQLHDIDFLLYGREIRDIPDCSAVRTDDLILQTVSTVVDLRATGREVLSYPE